MKPLIHLAICATLLTLPQTALADFVSSDGDRYTAEANHNGVVLTSVYPKARFIEDGTTSSILEGVEVLFLGSSCDAYSKAFGDGNWGWGNGGFVIDFDGGKRLAFPRQAPPDGAEIDCGY